MKWVFLTIFLIISHTFFDNIFGSDFTEKEIKNTNVINLKILNPKSIDSIEKGFQKELFPNFQPKSASPENNKKGITISKSKKKKRYSEEEEDYEEEEEEEEEEDRDEEVEAEDDEEVIKKKSSDDDDDEDEDNEEEEDIKPIKKKYKSSRKKYSSRDDEEEEVTSSRRRKSSSLKNDSGSISLITGTQYEYFRAIDRSFMSSGAATQSIGTASGNPLPANPAGTPFVQNLSQSSQSPGSQPSKPGIVYQVFPSISFGVKGDVYFYSTKENSFGLDAFFISTYYRTPIKYYTKRTTVVAFGYNAGGYFVWRARPLRDFKKLVLKPKIGARFFAFDGQNITGINGEPKFLFVDNNYLGLSLNPINGEYFFIENRKSRIGVKLSYDMLISPKYKESVFRETVQHGNNVFEEAKIVSGSNQSRKTGLINHFLEAGITAEQDNFFVYQLLGGFYLLDVYYNPMPDGSPNKGYRGNWKKEIKNAHINDQFFNLNLSIGMKF